MRALAVMLAACASPPKPVAPADPCGPAFGAYTQRWHTARAAELADVGFDAPTIEEMVATEVATLPTRDDLAKLRAQYTALVVFLPDAPWPRALDAAEVAIAACGEAANRP